MATAFRELLRRDLCQDPYFGDAVRFVFDSIGNVEGKTVLDNGCGTGQVAILFALKGAHVIGLDKRHSALSDAQRLAEASGEQHRLLFVNCDSEEMPIADASIDIIFSRSTIQYMDHGVIIQQYMRILKDDGHLAIIENLRYNPIINIYRLLRRWRARSEADIAYIKSISAYITVGQAEEIAKGFVSTTHREFHLLRIASIYLGRWLGRGPVVKKIDGLLAAIDRALFHNFPFMRRIAWFTAFVFVQKRYD